MPTPTHPDRDPFILVTGSAGFIGSHLVERLLRDGRRVTVIDDLSTGSLENLAAAAADPRLRVIRSRISACAELGELAAGAESIYHLASTVGVELVVRSALNVLERGFDETRALLRAASEHGTPVLQTSSSEVYGNSARAEFGEDDDLIIGPPGHSRWSYACAKLADEFLALACAREKNLPVTIARLFNTVGPRQTGRHGMVLPRFIAAAKEGRELRVYGDGGQSRCFCLVHDAVEALVRLQACPAARGGIFNVGGTEEVTILELARLVVESLGSRSGIGFVPYDQAYSPGFDDMRRRKPCTARLERTTGFRPRTPLREIIRLTAG